MPTNERTTTDSPGAQRHVLVESQYSWADAAGASSSRASVAKRYKASSEESQVAHYTGRVPTGRVPTDTRGAQAGSTKANPSKDAQLRTWHGA